MQILISRSGLAEVYTMQCCMLLLRPDLQIRICHFVLVWVLLWRGTEVNPISSCHYETLALNLTFDQFSVTAFSFFWIFVSLLKYLFLFHLTSDWIVAFGFAEDVGFLIKHLPVPLICHRLLKKSVHFNTSSIYQGTVCNRPGEQNCQWNHYVKMYGETCL